LQPCCSIFYLQYYKLSFNFNLLQPSCPIFSDTHKISFDVNLLQPCCPIFCPLVPTSSLTVVTTPWKFASTLPIPRGLLRTAPFSAAVAVGSD
jgi:hypothetical protein